MKHKEKERGDKGESKGRVSFRDLLKDKRILIFTASIVLFFGANAATLPLVGRFLHKLITEGNQHGRFQLLLW